MAFDLEEVTVEVTYLPCAFLAESVGGLDTLCLSRPVIDLSDMVCFAADALCQPRPVNNLSNLVYVLLTRPASS